MGNLLNLGRKNSTLSRQELIEMGRTAREERDRLLEKYPNLIDKCLDNAGSSENRMVVLGIMIEAKLKELREELSHLSSLMRQFSLSDHSLDG